MKKVLASLITGCLLYSSSVPAEQTLNAEEVTQLFSGNTYEATLPTRGLTMTVYADPNGTMRGIQNGHTFETGWKVNDQGEICVSYRDKMSCRIVVEDNGIYKKYQVDDKGKRILLVEYKSFTPGNSHGF